MTSTTLNICTAIGSAILVLYTAKETKRKKKEKYKNLWFWGYFLIALYLCIFSIMAFVSTSNEETDQKNFSNKRHSQDSLQIVSLQSSLSNLKQIDSGNFANIDSSLKPYHLQLENFKVVPITYNLIYNSQNVTSNNQKGGQTASSINNH